eukprot:8710556-Alexandrium_andersonii.AAC.1
MSPLRAPGLQTPGRAHSADAGSRRLIRIPARPKRDQNPERRTQYTCEQCSALCVFNCETQFSSGPSAAQHVANR